MLPLGSTGANFFDIISPEGNELIVVPAESTDVPVRIQVTPTGAAQNLDGFAAIIVDLGANIPRWPNGWTELAIEQAGSEFYIADVPAGTLPDSEPQSNNKTLRVAAYKGGKVVQNTGVDFRAYQEQ